MDVETDASAFTVSPGPPVQSTSKFVNYACQIEGDDDVFIEKQEDVKKFIERNYLRLDRFEYTRDGKEPGFVLIFNQENFEYSSCRKGSRRDVNEIILCLQRFGYNIDLKNVLTDCTRNEIIEKLKEVSSMNLAEYNSLLVFFLTHGNEYNQLETRDYSMTADEIWTPLATMRSLDKKPKMFVFQACKGYGYATTGSAIDSPSNIVPPGTFSKGFIYPDMFIVYSTIEGNAAFRNPLTGSWFIQEMCKNFFSYGKRDDVVSLITRTIKCVCGNYAYIDNAICKKQMPMFISTLRRKFYLNRNKDRDLLIKLIDTQEEILKELKEINLNVKRLLSEDEKKNKK